MDVGTVWKVLGGMLITQPSSSSLCTYIPLGFSVYTVLSGNAVFLPVVKKPWFMAAIPPSSAPGYMAGSHKRRRPAHSCTDKKKKKNWLTPVWPHTPSIHWLLGIDEVINGLFLSDSGENTDAHRCCRGYVQGLGKSSRMGCQGFSGPKPPLTPRAKKRKGFIKAEAVFGTFPKESILRNLLVSLIIMWCVCVCVRVRTWAHLNLPWVWLICAESGWTQGTFPPSLQSDDVTGTDALP